MEDRFKFRVWNKIKKEYAISALINQEGRLVRVDGCLLFDEENFVIEPCVGELYDDTEIFKNDIIEVKFGGEIYEVIIGDCIHDYQIRNDQWTYLSKEAITRGKLKK